MRLLRTEARALTARLLASHDVKVRGPEALAGSLSGST